MLDQERITTGKLKLAFNLAPNDVEGLLHALPHEAIFPFEVWEKVNEKYWAERAKVRAERYDIEFIFPTVKFGGDVINDNVTSLYEVLIYS